MLTVSSLSVCLSVCPSRIIPVMCANCSLRNILLELYRQFRSNELLVKYKQISQLCSKSIKDLTAQRENDLISDGKLGNFYKYINHKLNGSSGIGPLGY